MTKTKRLMAMMILAVVATMSTPQAYAGIMLGDRVKPGTQRQGIMLGDALRYVREVMGIMLGD